MLGAFIGSTAFQKRSMREKLLKGDRLKKLKKALRSGLGPQALMHMLTRSVNATATFLMRTHEPEVCSEPVKEFDEVLIGLATEIMGAYWGRKFPEEQLKYINSENPSS